MIARYIYGRFFSYFTVTTVGLCVLCAVIDYVGNMHNLSVAKVSELLRYYYYFTASFLSMLLPISMLLSVMLSVGSFAKTNELTAIKASGINVVKVTLPLVLTGILFSAGIFQFNESVLSKANIELEVYKNKFNARKNNLPEPEEINEQRRNFYYFSDDFTAYFFRRITSSPPQAEGVVRYEIEDYRVTKITSADLAVYDDEIRLWVFPQAVEKEIYPGKDIKIRHLTDFVAVDLVSRPVDMMKPIRKIEQMSYSDLQKRLENAKLRGEKTDKYLADSNFKFSLPLMNVVVVFIGIAVTARSGKRGGAVHFGAGLMFVFVYWAMAQFLIVLGRNESVDPVVAAWSPTVLFLIFGFLLYGKAAK